MHALYSTQRTIIKPFVKGIGKNTVFSIKAELWRGHMAFGFRGSSLAFLRLNLGPKTVLSAAMLIAVNTALVVGAGYWSLSLDFDARPQQDCDVTLRTLRLAFAEPYPDARITIRDGVVARIELAKMPEFA